MFGKNVGFACHIFGRELCRNRSDIEFFISIVRHFHFDGDFMKKIITFILLFTLTLSTFVGCKNDDGFKDVVSVTYTVDGQKKTEKSTAYMSLGVPNVEYISEEEYEAADSKYQVSSVGISTSLAPSSKTVSSISGFTNSDKGKYIYYRYVAWGYMGFGRVRGRDFDFGFAKYEITSEIQYNYIQVKVVDDDTIIIRNAKGETTYNVSTYSITYFD